jgi:hypothetical protein
MLDQQPDGARLTVSAWAELVVATLQGAWRTWGSSPRLTQGRAGLAVSFLVLRYVSRL